MYQGALCCSEIADQKQKLCSGNYMVDEKKCLGVRRTDQNQFGSKSLWRKMTEGVKNLLLAPGLDLNRDSDLCSVVR